ncbi:hypothetical protein M514_06814 [Trichuris suis]|uniref:Uncharacterized protein n=1 Tax=Trichuris suis TaxID=68888 RepID=A0A085NB67_9BILA|nr:hypothetical protein M513_06814 [Trichuris suis]KFD66713.1 hypothetical protein M514_06814 [Trichuris suis]
MCLPRLTLRIVHRQWPLTSVYNALQMEVDSASSNKDYSKLAAFVGIVPDQPVDQSTSAAGSLDQLTWKGGGNFFQRSDDLYSSFSRSVQPSLDHLQRRSSAANAFVHRLSPFDHAMTVPHCNR